MYLFTAVVALIPLITLMQANTLSKLVRIPGIIIQASVLSSRASKLHLQCRGCRSTRIEYPPIGLGGIGGGADRGLPRTCNAYEFIPLESHHSKVDIALSPKGKRRIAQWILTSSSTANRPLLIVRL